MSTGAALARHQSKQDYATPRAFLDLVRTLLGIDAFTVDLAATTDNAVCSRFISPEENALRYQVWPIPEGWGWLNPPFNDIAPWAERCARTARNGGKIAFLVPAAVGANWFRDDVQGHALVYALNGRLSFDGKNPYPKDCILCLYGAPPGFAVWNWRDGTIK